MATSPNKELNKELLELEKRGAFFAEPRLLICSGKKEALPRRKNDCHGDGVSFTSAAPKSHVLGKVKDFLGIMAEANKELELEKQENPEANFDIEALNGNETEIIEMDLLLGVADLQTPEAFSAAEAAVSGSGRNLPCSPSHQFFDTDDSSSDDSSSEDASGSDTNDDDEDKRDGHLTDGGRRSSSKCSKASQPNKRSKIVVLD